MQTHVSRLSNGEMWAWNGVHLNTLWPSYLWRTGITSCWNRNSTNREWYFGSVRVQHNPCDSCCLPITLNEPESESWRPKFPSLRWSPLGCHSLWRPKRSQQQTRPPLQTGSLSKPRRTCKARFELLPDHRYLLLIFFYTDYWDRSS